VYEAGDYHATVIDTAGVAHSLSRKALRPAFQQLIKPSEINAEMQPDGSVFRTLEIEGARFFKWHLSPWRDWCVAHARSCAAAAGWPCWLRAIGRIS